MRNIRLSERAKNKPSKTREIFSKVEELDVQRKRCGLNPIINLSIGQPHVSVNQTMKSGMIRHLASEACGFGYSPVAGMPETRLWISQLLNHYYPELNYLPKEVMCTNGANQGLWNAFSIFLDAKVQNKDAILTFSPYFGQYRCQVEELGGEIIAIDTSDTDFLPDPQRLEKTLSNHPNIRAVLLNYPNNPTGISLSQSHWKAIGEVLLKFPEVGVILDEVYRDLSFDGFTSLLEVMPSLKERTILIHSGSKGLMAAPDMRLGMVAAPEEMIKSMSNCQLLTTASVSRQTQMAIQDVVSAKIHGHTRAWERRAVLEYQNNTKLMQEGFSKLGFTVAAKPQAGFFLLIDGKFLFKAEIPHFIQPEDESKKSLESIDLHALIGTDKIVDDITLASYFLFAAGVATTPGSGFGLSAKGGYLRISCAAPMTDLYHALNRISQSLQQLKNVHCEKMTIPMNTSLINKPKNSSVAIIGMGNVGEWIIKHIITDIQRGLIGNLDKIYLVGNNSKKIEAKCSDQIQELLIDQHYESSLFQRHHSQLDLVDKLIATDNYADIKDVKYVITAFGAPMGGHIRDRKDLIRENARIADEVGRKIKQFCRKDVVLINIANPLDVITWTLMSKTGLKTSQVIGVAGNLDLTRLAQGITKKANCSYRDINFNKLHVLGEHGSHMVPILSKVNVKGKDLFSSEESETKSELRKFSIFQGTKMMQDMNGVPPHIAPAKAAVTLLRVMLSKEEISMPCSAWNPAYEVFMGVNATLNEHGVVGVQDIELGDDEKLGLKGAAIAIREMYEAAGVSMTECVNQ